MNKLIHSLKTKLYSNNIKIKFAFIVGISFIVLILMWVFQPSSHTEVTSLDHPTEFGVDIPAGYSLVAINLKNSKALSLMISHYGMIDVFLNNQIIARNLKIVKLTPNEEEPSFAALVPDKIAGTLQNIFSVKNLNGSLKKHISKKTEFFLPKKSSSLITKFITED